jgi:ribulose bisphosphate carboxylase small subunit
VKVEDIRMCIENGWKIGDERKRLRESNERGWTDQSKVYSHWRYNEKCFWTLT